jgi:hypothetical protein
MAHKSKSFAAGAMIEDFSPEDLELLGLYPVTETEPPEYTPETQKLVELSPAADESGEWFTQYSVINLTEAEVTARAIEMAPPPDYIGFQQAALNTPEFQAMIAAALPTAPLACMSLATLLVQVAQGQSSAPLVTAMDQVVAAAEPSEAALLQFIAAAQYFHLPELLIDALLRAHLPEPE